VTTALPDLLLSATDVAVTVTSGGAGTTPGAPYNPELVMVPQVKPEQPLPLILQVTLWLLVPVTLAVNCLYAPVTTSAVDGVTVTTTGGTIVTAADCDLVGSATEVAVTETCAGLGNELGAVYKPVDDTLPHAEPTQPLPLTFQRTDVLLVPLTVAVNCCVAPSVTVAVVGEMLTVIGGTIVTVAVLDLVESALEVTVT
jgi:hypothetical protein